MHLNARGPELEKSLPPNRHRPGIPPVAAAGWLEYTDLSGDIFCMRKPYTRCPELAEREWQKRCMTSTPPTAVDQTIQRLRRFLAGRNTPNGKKY